MTFYSVVKLTTEITDELKALPKMNPEPPLQDDPEGYHIWDSDPIDSSKDLVRATLPPSTLFTDRVLLHRGYSISEPNT